MISAVKNRLGRLGLTGRCLLLALLILAALAVIGPLAAMLFGSLGFSAAVVAAVAVWFAAAAGNITNELFASRGQSAAGILVGMMMRMIFPLVMCLVVQLNDGKLAESGFVFYVLAFYLVVLPLDTGLAVLRMSR